MLVMILALHGERAVSCPTDDGQEDPMAKASV